MYSQAHGHIDVNWSKYWCIYIYIYIYYVYILYIVYCVYIYCILHNMCFILRLTCVCHLDMQLY